MKGTKPRNMGILRSCQFIRHRLLTGKQILMWLGIVWNQGNNIYVTVLLRKGSDKFATGLHFTFPTT